MRYYFCFVLMRIIYHKNILLFPRRNMKIIMVMCLIKKHMMILRDKGYCEHYYEIFSFLKNLM
jgi:hypothetical protein